ncbi:MAG: hypothetical protein SPI19_03645 [Peptoniphilaceae bacterium]|nr:hypothetical protein [Peptoniphilaceae bacterium]
MPFEDAVCADDGRGQHHGARAEHHQRGRIRDGASNADGGVAEIVSFDEKNSNAWVVNGKTGKLDIVNIPDVNEDPGVDALNASQEMDVKEVFKENLPDGLPEGKDVLFGSRSFSIFEVGSDAPNGNATPSPQSGEVPTSKDHKDPNAAGKPQTDDGELAPSTTHIAPHRGCFAHFGTGRPRRLRRSLSEAGQEKN